MLLLNLMKAVYAHNFFLSFRVRTKTSLFQKAIQLTSKFKPGEGSRAGRTFSERNFWALLEDEVISWLGSLWGCLGRR